MKRAATLFILIGTMMWVGMPAHANPGPGDEVVVIVGNCDDGTTTVSAHNTQEIELGYLIRIDSKLVEQGTLKPGDRVERVYVTPLGESHFYRIRLGLQGEGRYFSDEGTTDRTNCPSETPPPSTTTPPPTTTTLPPTTSTSTTSTPPPTVKPRTPTPPTPSPLAQTGPPSRASWLVGLIVVLVIVGAIALRIGSRRKV